jgi:hypothetical protein
VSDLLFAALLHLSAVGNEGRMTLTAPSGIVRPFAAVSASRWDRETEVLMRAGLTTAGPLRASVGMLATDIEGDDRDGRRWAAVEVTWEL